MGAVTPILGLYKPGGGSTGTITPDETADIDRLNENFDAIDEWAGEVNTKLTLATAAEVKAGTNTAKLVTPATLQSKVAYAIAAGRSTSLASGDVTVTFPTDRFSIAPIIAITPRVSNKALVHIITSISATEVKVRLFDISNNTQTAGAFDWTAVQMTPSAAPG